MGIMSGDGSDFPLTEAQEEAVKEGLLKAFAAWDGVEYIAPNGEQEIVSSGGRGVETGE